MTNLKRALQRAHQGERGMVLANVIIFGTVMMLMVATMIAVSVSGAVKSAADRNWQNAMAATYAGLADYQSKLSNDNGYAVYGDAASQFSKSSGSVFQSGSSNDAFAKWVPVSGATDEWFRYEVDNSNYSAKGVLRVRVSGKAGNAVRSLVANLKGDGFINYLYFTNYESAQPATTNSTCTSEYQWSAKNTTCDPVQFGGGDVLNGPVRTNDTFTSCGATFNGTVESHNGVVATTYNGCSAKTAFNGGNPSPVPYLGMPALNANMSQEARTDLPTTVPRPGCLYTGPTTIKFLGNGKMTVWSPWTKATQIQVDASSKAVSETADTAKEASTCGSASDLASAGGATIPTVPSNLVYVQDVPSSNSPKNINFWDSGTYPSGYTNTYCNTKVTVGAKSVTYTGNQAYANGQGYPAANEWINNGRYGNTSLYQTGNASDVYGCTSGDVFVSGAFSGVMTIAASGTVWLTGNVTYVDSNNDILGLVGQNAVEVSNPARCSSYYQPQNYGTNYCQTTGLLNRTGAENLTVEAAIASNAGTFWNQNYMLGNALGTLTVKGSIAQNWRGAVATSSGGRIVTGFTKNYQYDNRLLTTAPPKFLQPVSTSYGVTTQVEVQAAYQPDGTCAKTTGGACR